MRSPASPCSRAAGRIELGPVFHAPEVCTVTRFGSEPAASAFPLPAMVDGERYNFTNGQGMCFEAQAAQKAILAGKLECEECPWTESLAVLRTMDEVNAHWHLLPVRRRQSVIALAVRRFTRSCCASYVPLADPCEDGRDILSRKIDGRRRQGRRFRRRHTGRRYDMLKTTHSTNN